MLTGLLVCALLAYLLVGASVYYAQTSIFFPVRIVPPAGPLAPGSEHLSLTAPDGVRLEGVHIPAVGRGDPGRAALLAFAGNASNAAGIAAFLHDIYPAHDVIAFHYRGYKPSGGEPGATALIEDAPLLFDLAAERLGARPIVAIGISMGSGVAASLAACRPLAGLILVTPFDSLKATAQQLYPWLPVRWLLRHDIPSAQLLREANLPVAIVAAERDRLIRPERTDALRRSLRNLVYDAVIPGANHLDVATKAEFRPAMLAALQRISAAR